MADNSISTINSESNCSKKSGLCDWEREGRKGGTMEDLSWCRLRSLSYEKHVISTGCLMIAQGPVYDVKGSIGKECFWRDAEESRWRLGGGEADIFEVRK